MGQPLAENSENPVPAWCCGQGCWNTFSFVSTRNETQQEDSREEAMEGAVQVCRNCKRSVASAHLTLHEAHCMLFLVLCPECKEPVPQAKMDEHCETGHQQVGCAMCQQLMQKHLLEFHETTECQERPTECRFCGVAMRLGKLEIHEHHCGSRTELCLDCGQLVVVQGLAQHKDACQREQAQSQKGKRISAPENNISRHDCNQMTPGNKYLYRLDKRRTDSESAKYLPIGEPTISPPSLPKNQAAEDQTSTAKRDVRPKTKNINRFPLLSETSTKRAPSDTKPRITSPVEDETTYDILRRCPQCDILLPLPTLNQHQRCRSTQELPINQEEKSLQLFCLNYDHTSGPHSPDALEDLCPSYIPISHSSV